MAKTCMAAAAVASLALVGIAPASAAECSLATLKGTYIFSSYGVDKDGKNYGDAGKEIYDGAGRLKLYFADAGSKKVAEDVATYTLDADCIGTTTYSDGSGVTMFVAPDGSRFSFVSSKGDLSFAGEEYRVAE
ncbi:MAG: hypothetical protein U1E45_10890 [Geminicoccaceae bacterium]